MQRLKASFFTVMNNEVFKSILWWGLGIGIILGCSLNTISGYDWIICFRPQALDMSTDLILNPMWTYIPLYPVALLPVRLSLAVFSVINLIVLYFSSTMSKSNRYLLLLSFPAFWIFWYGQLDMLVMFGAVLGYWAIDKKKPVLSGVSILLLFIKPHIGAPLALAYFIWSRNWRTMATIAVVFLLSLILWGFNWPLFWIENLLHASTEGRMTQDANIGLFPFGLLSWFGLFISMPWKDKSIYIAAATISSLNYVGSYSLILVLGMAVPWWAYILSSAPYFLGTHGFWITSLVPVFIMVWLIIKNTPIHQYLKKVFTIQMKNTME